MQLGIFAKTFAGNDPATVMRAAKASGFDCVQYNMACSGLPAMPDAIADRDVDAIASAGQQTGIKVAAVSGTYNMIHPDPAAREVGLKRLAVLAAQASRMGTGVITLCTGTRDPDDQWRHHPGNQSAEAWRDLLQEMTKAVAIAEASNVSLGIEPELANVVNSAERAKQLLDDLPSRRLRIVLDPANLFEQASLSAQKQIVAKAIDILADHIAIAHAKDRNAKGEFVAAGKGVLDYGHFIKSLRGVGFEGPLITHGLDADEAPSVAKFLKEQLA
jgi:sugar phosphate isomerase/epimerase